MASALKSRQRLLGVHGGGDGKEENRRAFEIWILEGIDIGKSLKRQRLE